MSLDFPSLEHDQRAVVAQLGDVTAREADQDIQMFLSAGEYGLAFETLCSVLRAGREPVSASVWTQLADLGERMGIEPAQWAGLMDSSLFDRAPTARSV